MQTRMHSTYLRLNRDASYHWFLYVYCGCKMFVAVVMYKTVSHLWSKTQVFFNKA